MRKIFSFIGTTLDGYYEGPNQEFDWPVVDAEFAAFSVEQLDEVDTIVMGRVTYQGMAAYWPTPEAIADDPATATRMNDTAKIVVSRTLDKADWTNTRIVTDDVAGELTALKRRPGKDIAVFGSSDLTAGLIHLGLVDEVRIMVNPIVLGAGKSLFHTSDTRISLTLLQVRHFSSGNVLLYYRPETPQGSPTA
ncbi:dihydrofolate reductase family protein [Actinokineospora sp.]|uniref:dihydrofolate reductase family protein n=1 Tax=Actinokineospora sp. TaxID=1872133 RepID=UPI004037D66C